VADGPLQGRRVVVTRPREQAGPLADALEQRGATVSVVPLVEIRPVEDTRTLDAAIEELADYDWIVFTSANGVAAVGSRLPGPLEWVLVAAVGPATADAVRALGTEPSFVPERFAAEEIAAGLGSLAGARVLLPQADIADPGLADELRARGAIVDAIVVYRTVEIAPDMSGMLALRVADAIVLASPSAARSLAALASSVETIRGRLIVGIGPTTAAAARETGLPVGVVAPEATDEGIIRALTAHFEQSP
jgi:uroporphyrinogen III methyltransferase / synthase